MLDTVSDQMAPDDPPEDSSNTPDEDPLEDSSRSPDDEQPIEEIPLSLDALLDILANERRRYLLRSAALLQRRRGHGGQRPG